MFTGWIWFLGLVAVAAGLLTVAGDLGDFAGKQLINGILERLAGAANLGAGGVLAGMGIWRTVVGWVPGPLMLVAILVGSAGAVALILLALPSKLYVRNLNDAIIWAAIAIGPLAAMRDQLPYGGAVRAAFFYGGAFTAWVSSWARTALVGA